MKKYIFILLMAFTWSAFSQTILFLGDSLTEGYRLSKEEAYPALIEKELKPKRPKLKIINGGVSGATTASGLKRLDWYLKAKPEIMVLALGANDGLRGLKVEEAEKNLAAVIEKAEAKGIYVILAGMKIPTNYGDKYRSEFEKIFPRLAKKYDLVLIPFLLEGVATKTDLNLADGIHPNARGHKIMAKTVLKYLEPTL